MQFRPLAAGAAPLITASIYTTILPITGIDDELSYLLQTGPIVIIEAALRQAVQIKDAETHFLPRRPEDQGTDDLTLRVPVAGDVSRICLHVGHNDGPARQECICAHTPALSWGGVNGLTSRLAAERSQEQLAGWIGSSAVIHTNLWSRK